jgi:hypothetical protein
MEQFDLRFVFDRCVKPIPKNVFFSGDVFRSKKVENRNYLFPWQNSSKCELLFPRYFFAAKNCFFRDFFAAK